MNANVTPCDCAWCRCTAAEHDAIRADDRRWYEDTEYLGCQDDGAGGRLELRNCRRCHSTLARPWDYYATAVDMADDDEAVAS